MSTLYTRKRIKQGTRIDSLRLPCDVRCIYVHEKYSGIYQSKELDPRLFFQKQMRLVYERPKAFMRGCIDVSGSTIGIHHDQPIPDGPVLYVHPKLRPADLLLLADILKSRLVLSLARKLSGCRFSEIGCV